MYGKFIIRFKQKKQVDQKQAELKNEDHIHDSDFQNKIPQQRSSSVKQINTPHHMREIDKLHNFAEDKIVKVVTLQKLKNKKIKNSGDSPEKQSEGYESAIEVLQSHQQIALLIEETKHVW